MIIRNTLKHTIKISYFVIICFTVSLNGCAWLWPGNWGLWGSQQNNRHASAHHGAVPKVAHYQQPGGNNEDSWRYLGISDDGTIVDEVNINSIHATKYPHVYSFVDRKTVVDMQKFNYPDPQLQFKYLLSTWQINCTNHSYLLNTAKLYSSSGTLIKNDNYVDSDIKWLKIGDGSFAQMQYSFVCLGINRNLGY